jgi:hypothetical protein
MVDLSKEAQGIFDEENLGQHQTEGATRCMTAKL